ncbi:hypothetical protein SAMN05421504_106476 [Amycolatopsis xylanica]|uniref:Uncharacterized protein n=1 Tax=Amycolatopsis xylanica TaxID=589385 RepID=A0A1H3M3K1_9PSEU|nr:hypothetical protein [Amycolatopsis xylanica]SDY71173.1 hypothetical protein SAMN05421504_106476 [Amycolatopsis xylanica]
MEKLGSRAPRSVLVTAAVAMVVVVGTLVAVVALRPRADQAEPASPSAGPRLTGTADPTVCGQAPCQTIATQVVNGGKVTLLAGPDSGVARLDVDVPPSDTIVDLTITEQGVKLSQDSLRCLGGAVPACLVRGPVTGGQIGEVVANRGSNWEIASQAYLSDANYIGLADVSGSEAPEVTVVRHDCPTVAQDTPKCAAAPVVAEVFDLGGRSIGCTKRRYTSPSQMRGYPTIRLSTSDLGSCS